MFPVEVVSQITTQHADGIATAFNRGISDKRQLLFEMTAFNISAKHAEQIVIIRIAKHIVAVKLGNEGEPPFIRREVRLEKQRQVRVTLFESLRIDIVTA